MNCIPNSEVECVNGIREVSLVTRNLMNRRILIEGEITSSMAAIILAGGTKGHSFIPPHSRVMIHEPLLFHGVGGLATPIKKISESILETRSICNGILAKYTG